MAKGTRESRTVAAIAARLIATREALGLNQRKLCKLTGLEANRYNQWEKAVGRPSLEGAFVLCDTFALTLDWIYFGDPAHLPLELAEKILGGRPSPLSPLTTSESSGIGRKAPRPLRRVR